MTKPNYVVDAPGVVHTILLVGAGLLAVSAAIFVLAPLHDIALWISAILLIPALYALFMSALILWGSLIAKVRTERPCSTS